MQQKRFEARGIRTPNLRVWNPTRYQLRHSFVVIATGQWSSGMIPALGAGGRGFDSGCALSRLAQLVERKTLNLVVVGSSPTVGRSGAHGATAARRIPDPKVGGSNPSGFTYAFLAQMVERGTFNAVVAGSSPAEGA